MAKFDSSLMLFVLMTGVLECMQVTTTTTTTAATSSSIDDGPSSTSSCADVRHIYVAKRVGTPEMVPEVPVSGTELQICKSRSSCCTKEMEDRFQLAVTGEFANIMQSASSHLKNLFANSIAKFQDGFLDMVRSSENKTNVLFSEVYHKIGGHSQVLVDKLYSGLADFVLGKDVDLESSVSSPVTCFFDALFPLVYHHTINPKLRDFDDDYKECLRETRTEVKPFGDIPQRVASSVSRNFQAARTFLHALQLGIEVMNGTDHLEIGVECQKALMKLLYCPQCRSLVSAKSCNGYCMNVVRGCLANMAEIDQPWSDFVLGLDRLTNSMRAGLVLDDVTGGLDAKITEAIMYAMENGPELSNKVKMACGHPKRTTSDVPMGNTSPVVQPATAAVGDMVSSLLPTAAVGSVQSSTVPNPSLVVQLQAFVRRLVHSKNFYASLPDTLCSDDSLAVRTERNCWNGENLGEYTKTIAGNGISAQKYNPEIRMQYGKDEKISQLIDKLKKMRQILHTRSMSLPESESMLVNDGSGSGYSRNGDYDDDEDYSYSSGSGYYEERDFEDKSEETVPRSDPDLVFTGEENHTVRKYKKQSVDHVPPTQPTAPISTAPSSSVPGFVGVLLTAAIVVVVVSAQSSSSSSSSSSSLPWLNG